VAVALSVTVLGCSGSYPGPGAACSGYLVRGGRTTVWLDAGSGTMANLQRHVALDAVDAVVLTHEHPDHWRDVEGLYVAYRYGPSEREGIPIYAPAGLPEQTYFDTEPVFAWHAIADGDRVAIGDLSFRFSRTDHGPETLATRIDGDGSAIAYTADTGPAWSLSSLGEGIDIALCESTIGVEDEGTVQHLSGRQAGAMASTAGVKRLVLTHLWPTLDRASVENAARGEFKGPIEMAAIGEEYSV
jgi:ribonuclease BN (tRNA processing enzyme)